MLRIVTALTFWSHEIRVLVFQTNHHQAYFKKEHLIYYFRVLLFNYHKKDYIDVKKKKDYIKPLTRNLTKYPKFTYI